MPPPPPSDTSLWLFLKPCGKEGVRKRRRGREHGREGEGGGSLHTRAGTLHVGLGGDGPWPGPQVSEPPPQQHLLALSRPPVPSSSPCRARPGLE